MGNRPVSRLCVHWPRLGPYHAARLAGTQLHAKQRGAELIALETAGSDDTYAWDRTSLEAVCRREVVFPDRIYETIGARAMHRSVTAALDRLQPDAVAITSYSTPDARASLMWCVAKRRPAVLMYETKEDDMPRKYWRERIKSSIVGLFDAALVGGTPHRRYLEKLGFPGEAIFQSCDAVDNSYFQQGAERVRRAPQTANHLPGLDDGTPFFLASNRFIPRKNLDTLLLAYKQYRSQTASPWRLLMLGDGPDRARLHEIIAQHAIEGVVFCGFRQIDELPAYYGLAGAFVHPASNDQWGLVVNEAMATGLAVLVSEKAGCAHDLVEPGVNGFIFAPDNSADLAQFLKMIASEDVDRAAMGAASRARIESWSPEQFGKNLWLAVETARNRTSRNLVLNRMVLYSLQRLSRRVDSFHLEEPVSHA